MSRLASRATLRGILIVLAAASFGLVGAGLLILLLPWSPVASSRVAHIISKHLDVDASLGGLSITWLPRPRISGRGLVIRLRNVQDAPPFVTVDRFWVDVGLMSIVTAHVGTVHLTGLHVVVPPEDMQQALGGTSGERPSRGDTHVLIDHLVAADSDLKILRRGSGKDPVYFAIQALTVDHVGYERQMPFTATLTNPVPHGNVAAHGLVGPWQKTDPAALPVSGDYDFTNVDLSTIKGIAGALTSQGHFDGRLAQISVAGTARTPDFSLDLGGTPLPLTATFKALVNGTDGTTRLDDVQAKLLNTPIGVRGAITNLPGPGNHDVSLEVTIEHGRVEDLLRLAIDSPTPSLVGDVSVHTTFMLPPGPTPVRDRLTLSGRFGLERTRFTDPNTEARVSELSRRSQGLGKDSTDERVMTDLSGTFSLAHGVLTLPHLAFHVPGARVALSGTYAVSNEVLDFAGTLRMTASVSDAVGGVKSIFLKPFDFIFRKDGAGAVVPITIKGTRQAPKMGVSIGKAIGGGF